MKTLLVGECSEKSTYRLADPDAPTESEFEATAVRSLMCAYPNYHCVIFGGTFVHDGSVGRRPDLALVAKDMSHWFIIEVELTSHSLEHHVLPQVRAFSYGRPQADCAAALAIRLGISHGQAETLVSMVPRTVAVVANRKHDEWVYALRALNAQLLVVSVFKTDEGGDAYEIDGDLRVVAESLGFGKYSAVDRSIRFKKEFRLPRGEVQLVDDQGAAATWTAREEGGALWVTRVVGTPDIKDGMYVQVVRTYDGRLLLRVPEKSPGQ